MKRDDAPAVLAIQPITRDVLQEKYLKPGETDSEDLFARVARALASVEAEPLRAKWEERFEANLRAGAIGAGRIMSAAGTSLQATLINCFVQPVGDSIQGIDAEGYPGIYEALREAAETMRRGGGVGYDFSRIRPRGAEVSATASIASGPCSYIDVFDHSCATVESAGARRGAQMGVLRIDHPDVLEFITAKRKPGRWSNFNVSVAVPNAFMKALEAGGDWDLVHKARPGKALMEAGRAPARRRHVGVPHAAGGAAVGHRDEVGLRLRRARHHLPRHDQPRQQPALLREHRRDEPVRRATAARLRLLRPRPDHPHPLRAPAVRLRRRAAVRLRGLRRERRRAGARARQRAGPHLLAPAAAAGRSGAPSAASAWASPAWATRWPCCACATTSRRAARWP